MHGVCYIVRMQVVAVILQVIKRSEFLWLFVNVLYFQNVIFGPCLKFSFLVVRASLLRKRETGMYLFLMVVVY